MNLTSTTTTRTRHRDHIDRTHRLLSLLQMNVTSGPGVNESAENISLLLFSSQQEKISMKGKEERKPSWSAPCLRWWLAFTFTSWWINWATYSCIWIGRDLLTSLITTKPILRDEWCSYSRSKIWWSRQSSFGLVGEKMCSGGKCWLLLFDHPFKHGNFVVVSVKNAIWCAKDSFILLRNLMVSFPRVLFRFW